MKNLLDTSKCPSFEPSFSDTECSYYEFAETESMEPAIGECGYCKRPGAYRCVADVARVVPLSHSSIDTFLTCHYLYYLKKILGIEMRPPFFGPALKAGRLWDVIKQRHLGAAISIKDTIEEYEIDPLTVAKVRALYHGYKEFDIQVEPGHTLQAPVDIKLPIKVPAASFIPAVTKENSDPINLWIVRDKLSDNDTEWLFELSVSGFYDRKYPTYFCEDKLSSRPEFYLDPFFIQSQNGTYFLADENLEYCVQEVVSFLSKDRSRRKTNRLMNCMRGFCPM